MSLRRSSRRRGMDRIRFSSRQAAQPHYHAHRIHVGKTFAGSCGRPDAEQSTSNSGKAAEPCLREFAIERPEAVLGYLKRIAANATHDYFKHSHSQSSGGENWHVSTVSFSIPRSWAGGTMAARMI